MNQDQTRYERGWAKLKEVDREQGERVIAALADIAPDLGRFVIEFGFGDVISRPGLDLKTRELTIFRRCGMRFNTRKNTRKI